MIIKRTAMWAVAALVLAAVAIPSRGAVTFTITETGGNVVITGSGSYNLTDTSPYSSNTITAEVVGNPALLLVGADPTTSVLTDAHTVTPLNGPGAIGPTDTGWTASTGSGDRFGFGASAAYDTLVLIVPPNYISGDPLAGTTTYPGDSLAHLGLNPGTYEWTWGSGANADSLTVNIMPEPASLALLGLGGLIMFRRRRTE